MAPQVIETLIGRLPVSCEAHLTGHMRHPVRGLVVSDPLSCTAGVLYRDLSMAEMKRLDWFEDTEYTRTKVSVSILNPKSTVETETYLWSNPLDELHLDREWSYADFVELELQEYLSRTVKPCRIELDRLGDI